jgi:hypothetical protein
MEEVGVTRCSRPLPALRELEERELSIAIIHAEGNDSLAEKIPEKLQ